MRGLAAGVTAITLLIAALTAAGAARAQSAVEIDFVPSTAAHGYAVRAYEAIWDEYGQRVVAALQAQTCLPVHEARIAAVIADAASHSGGPEHPMRLRASYPSDVKRATLVHELGHRHLWQLEERLDELDGHMTLFLVLDRVWAEVWGERFAADRVRDESGWVAGYDYATAWSWARALPPAERARLWNELLALNGFEAGCSDAQAAQARAD